MEAIKGIKFQFYIKEGNLELLLKRYSKAINLFLEKYFWKSLFIIKIKQI